MTLLLIFLLVLLWGAVIVPTLLRVRQSPSSSVGTFRKNMQALGARSSARATRHSSSSSGPPGRWILGPPAQRPSRGYRPSPSRGAQSRAAARPRPQARPASTSRRSGAWDELDDTGRLTLEQRRTIFFGLVVAAAFSLLLGFAYGVLLRVHLGIDVALVGYVVYLVRTKPRREFSRQFREPVTYHAPVERRPQARERDGYDDREWLRAGEL